MKRFFNRISALVIASTIILTSCEGNGEGGADQNQILEPFTIEVDGEAVDNVVATITYDAAAPAAPYFVGVVEASVYDANYTDDTEMLLRYAADNVEQMGAEVDFTNLQPDDKFVFEGSTAINVADSWQLERGVRYYVFALGLASDGATLTTNIELCEFRTNINEGPIAELKSFNEKSFKLEVSKNGSSGRYAIMTLTQATYDQVTSENSSLTDFDIMSQFIAFKVANDLPFSTYASDATITITQDQNGASLRANTQYKIFIFTCDENKGKVLSEPYVIDATTADYPEGTEMLKSITVSEISHTNACVTVDPGDYEGNYFMLVIPKSECDLYYGDDEALMAYYIQSLREAGMNLSTAGTNSSLVFNGINHFNANMLWLLSSDVEHYAFAVGVGPNFGIQSTPVIRSEVFTTLVQPELKLDIEFEDEGTPAAMFKITPNYDDISYLATFMKHSVCGNDSAEDLLETYLMTGYVSYFLFTGTTYIPLNEYEIVKDIEYKVFAFGYDLYGDKITSDLFTYMFTGTGNESAEAAAKAPLLLRNAAMGRLINAPKTLQEAVDRRVANAKKENYNAIRK